MDDLKQVERKMLEMELRVLVLEKALHGIVKEHPMMHYPNASDLAGIKAEAHYELQKKYPDKKIPSPFG
ncbi:MAG TPA: hypothetical protein VJ917_10360 [Saprospiraceae bacterium]|nr:hypothetical protein [Saprospiraceae bacterium]